MDKKQIKRFLKKTWYFIWESDSPASWVANIVLAFLLIYFIVYPGLGFIFQTTHPIVAVVSESMDHRTTYSCINGDCSHNICGAALTDKYNFNLEEYWNVCGNWYDENTDITKTKFEDFIFKNGFNKGDIIVLRGVEPEKIEIGDVLVFWSTRSDPIIHRVVKIKGQENNHIFQTKGDHNADSYANLGELEIPENKVVGYQKYQKTSRAVLRIPYLGWIKIAFVNNPVIFLVIVVLFISITSYWENIVKYLRGQ